MISLICLLCFTFESMYRRIRYKSRVNNIVHYNSCLYFIRQGVLIILCSFFCLCCLFPHNILAVYPLTFFRSLLFTKILINPHLEKKNRKIIDEEISLEKTIYSKNNSSLTSDHYSDNTMWDTHDVYICCVACKMN